MVAETLVDYCRELADALDRASRQGGSIDKPEGARYVQLSDTLAKQIADRLRLLALDMGVRSDVLEVGAAIADEATLHFRNVQVTVANLEDMRRRFGAGVRVGDTVRIPLPGPGFC